MIEAADLEVEEPQTQFNQLLNNRIGYGPAQQQMLRPLNLLNFSEGCETIALGLILPVLTSNWNLSIFEQSLVLAIVNAGVPIGTLLQGFADKIGRAAFIFINAMILTISGLLSIFCWNLPSFIVVRFLYCIGIGIGLPITAAFTAQISPYSYKDYLLSRAFIFWSFGYFFSCILGWMFLDNNQWRLMLLLICFPNILALIAQKIYGRQSLHYLWIQKDLDKTYQMTKQMCEMNSKPIVLKQELNQLMRIDHQSNIQRKQLPWKQLFSQKYLSSTIRLMAIWITVCFVYYGITLLLPTILHRVLPHKQQNSTFKYLYLIGITIVELFGCWLSPRIISHSLLSKKRAVYIGLIISSLASIIIVAFQQKTLFVLFSCFALIKISNIISLTILFSLTAEVYEIMIRSRGLAVCSILGRIATVLLGIVGVSSLEWFDGNGLYFLFIFLGGIASCAALTLPEPNGKTSRIIDAK